MELKNHIQFFEVYENSTLSLDDWDVRHECRMNITSTKIPTTTRTQTHTWGFDLSNTLQGTGGVGGLLSSKYTNSETTQHHSHTYDANGNTSELIKSTGELDAHYQYDPFGKETISTGPWAPFNTYRFSTKPWDITTELNYYGYRFYAPGNGRWINRDPIEEADSENLYLFNSTLQGIDVLGLSSDRGNLSKKTDCKGKCGAIADDWIMAELESQEKGWNAYLKLNPKHRNDIDKYLLWANGNQRYKDSGYFKFNSGTSCGTQPDKSKPGCGMSVTLCSHCVKSSILGNIVYGFIGSIAGFTENQIVEEASRLKNKYGWLPNATYDPYDEKAYRLGFALGTKWKDMQKVGFCTVFNESLESFPEALYEGNKSGGYNDPSTCEPCNEKTKERRHGGNESPRRWP